MPKSMRTRYGKKKRNSRLRRYVRNSPLPPAISPLNPPGSILPAGLKRVQAAYNYPEFNINSASSPGWATGLQAVASPIAINNIYDPLILSNGELTTPLFDEYRPAVGHDVYAGQFDEYVVVSTKVSVECLPIQGNTNIPPFGFSVALCPTIQDQQTWEAQVGDFSNLLALGYPVKTVDADASRPLVHSCAVSMKNLYEMKESITNAGDEYAASFYALADIEPAKQARMMLIIKPSVDNQSARCHLKVKVEYLLLPRAVKVPKLDAKVTSTPPGINMTI